MLEDGRTDSEKSGGIKWLREKAEVAPKLVCQLDRRSMTAVEKGFVQLPGGRVSASQWFKMLQTIFHELNAPLFSLESSRFKLQLQLWTDADYNPAGPFEKFRFDKSCSLLIAMAIALMESGEVIPTGIQGKVFCCI